MVGLINDDRATYGVEPICAVLPIAPSTYFGRRTEQCDATRRSPRAQRDEELRAQIRRVWDEHHQVYRPRKVRKPLQREMWNVARCTVERLMRQLGFPGWACPTVKEPHVRHIRALWEIRLKGKAGTARTLYVTAKEQRLVILRSFIKKFEKTSTGAIIWRCKRATELNP